jgi:transposase
MMLPGTELQVLVAARPVDFRKQADTLAAFVQEVLAADPWSGAVYVFRAKRIDRVKLLWWDGTGICLLTKRLEAGAFRWPPIEDGVMRLTPGQFAVLPERALCPQVLVELLEDPFVWRERGRRCRRNRFCIAQHLQPSLECCPVSGLDRLPARSVPKVPLDKVLIEIGQRAATAVDPAQEPANHIEATPCAVPSEPLLDETSGV